ncbi:MAG: hypothetical protein IIY77_02625, partial [Lachnospiraceae bacterium]|nr:hypothetical protein [Lachnospiraceae bacterium]
MRKTTRFYFLRKALCIFLAAFLLTQPMAAVFAEPGETADKPGYTHIIAVIEREEKEPVILEASGPLYSVKAELDPEEVLPEDEDGSIALSFQAREITEGMPEYPDYLERLEDVLKKEDEEQEVKKARFFDLSLKKAGDSDFEPEHPVKLTISLDLPLTEDEEDTLQVVCFDEEEAVFAEAAGTVSPEMSSPQAGSEETTLTENEQDSASSDEETAAFMPGEFSFLTKDLSVVSRVAAGLPGENAGLMAA